MKRISLIVLMSLLLCFQSFGGVPDIEAPLSDESKENIELEFAGLTATFYPEPVIKYSNSDQVNVRSAPNLESEILDQLLLNTSVEVLSECDEWSCIATESNCAYVKSEFLQDNPVPEPAYTDEDLYIMAHALAGECHTYPDEEQLYVGSVILNRVNHAAYPNTIEDVVFQRGQYACTWDGNYYREPTEQNWANAQYLLKNGSILPEYVVFQSGGKQGSGVYLKTKWHYYCY